MWPRRRPGGSAPITTVTAVTAVTAVVARLARRAVSAAGRRPPPPGAELPGWLSKRALWGVVAGLFLASAVGIAVHDPPPDAPAGPRVSVEEDLAARSPEDLAGQEAGPSGPIAAAPSEEGNRPPAAISPPAPKQVTPGSSRAAGAPLEGPAGLEAYRGMGTWVDVYDWSRTYTNGQPRVSPPAVDRMAEQGVQTLFIQASKHDAPGDVLEPELLREWTERARDKGIRVVAWYLPTLVDPARDLARMVAIAGLRVDSVAVDIEAKDVKNLAERNQRLVSFSAALRKTLPGRTIGGIVLPPVVLEAVNPLYWPGFPYRQLASHYDVWLTMGYWTNRSVGTAYRDAHRYTSENVARLRANLGLPGAVVHPIGGIGDRTTPADAAGYLRAAQESNSIGGSLYDWRTTRPELWDLLRRLRR